MNKAIEELYGKAAEYLEKYKDEELNDYLLQLATRLEDADMMKHQFNYLLMHSRTAVAYPVRTKHFQEALERAERYLNKVDEES